MNLLVLDLDGTITKSDNLVGFSVFMIKKMHLRFLLILPLWIFLRLKLIDSLKFKAWYAALILRNSNVSFIAASAAEYVNSEAFRRDLNPGVTDFIGKQTGAEKIMISANYCFIASPVSEFLSIAQCRCINLEVTNGRYTGKISGTIPQGAGKVEVFRQFVRDRTYIKTIGLGDSRSDLLLLKNLDEGYLVRYDSCRKSTSFEPVSG
jgi:HAD superfamily phosphoserine phosphatase-like hydrolase